MICPKCSGTVPDGSTFCNHCGKKLVKQETKVRTKARGNGTGMAYKRGKTWTARVTIGWDYVDGKKIRKYRTKGGFPSKTAAENYCYTLKTNPNAPKPTDTFAQIYDRWQKEYDGRIADCTMATYKAAWKYYKDVHPLPITDLTVSQLQECITKCQKGRRSLCGIP